MPTKQQPVHDNSEVWTPEISLFVRRQLIDGTTAEPTDLVMRRKVESGYEYRRPTAEEAAEYASFEAW